jgi:osmoprotectant transport system substrate-binding protein
MDAVMRRTGRAGRVVAALAVAWTLAACESDDRDETPATVLHDDRITIGSFDFAESEVLARLYADVLEMHGYDVDLQLAIGPRELLLPALAAGLIELVPEYAGTALHFISTGDVQPDPDPATTHAALIHALASDGRIVALDAAPAQDANAIVVTQATADRYGLETISDLVPVAGELTFGGPPECPSRPFCLRGLEERYKLRFGEFLALDAGGPVTRAALREGHADVALLFTTDSSITRGGFVELVDDLGLQPAENVTPLVHVDVVRRWGPDVEGVIADVSRRLSTEELRGLNLRISSGATVADAADAWLRAEGLR